MNGAALSLGHQELWKRTVKIIQDKWGNGILLAIRDDEEVAGAHGIPVIVPARTRKDTRLGTFRCWSSVLCVCRCIHASDVELAAALVQDKSHVIDECFVLNPSFNRVVFHLGRSLQDWDVVGGRRGRNRRRGVGGPFAVREFVKVIDRVVNQRRRVGYMILNGRGSIWGKRGKREHLRVQEFVVRGCR